ncbi:MAG: 3-methyl-2-oxobutanoate hydroxymethyltransferase [Nitrospirae bacterium]|nr:3-methyl-2-oxobutanoate hydroxymethyltransferase [Nitrospirota bacterium]
MTEKVTIPDLIRRKRDGGKITVVTAYDYPSARILDEAGIDMVLVGDSLASVVQGEATTLPVTMDEMVYHTRIVSRGVRRALVVADMPFLSYQTGVEEAVRNAGRFLKEGGAAAVKVEGGAAVRSQVEAMIVAGIPVMGHAGLLPQSVHRMGGYRVQGKDEASAARVLEDAVILNETGVFAMVLEGIPADLSRRITEAVGVPTIGIGAGVHCDGQVLVWHDLLGLTEGKIPKFVRQYARLRETALAAVRRFKEDVDSGKFPGPGESY